MPIERDGAGRGSVTAICAAGATGANARGRAAHRASAVGRARRRSRRRGATMFVVTLVMALLTGMGVFAGRAAGLTERASGYDRLNEQTHYLLQHGVGLVMGEIARSPESYSDPTAPQMKQACFSGQWTVGALPVNVSYPCVKFNTDSLAGSLTAAQSAGGKPIVPPVSPALLENGGVPNGSEPPTVMTPGSLGPTPLNSRIFVEFSDFNRIGRPPAGTAVGGSGTKFTYLLGTLSAWAQIGPYTPNGNVCGVTEQNNALITARETGRSYVVVGPLPSFSTSN